MTKNPNYLNVSSEEGAKMKDVHVHFVGKEILWGLLPTVSNFLPVIYEKAKNKKVIVINEDFRKGL